MPSPGRIPCVTDSSTTLAGLSGGMNRIHTQAFDLLHNAVIASLTSAYKAHLATSPSHPRDPSKFFEMAMESLDFAKELAGYYSTLHQRPINIAVFGGVKLDPENHPAKYDQVMRLGALAIKNGIGVKSGWGPGAMEASLKGALQEFKGMSLDKQRSFFPNGKATVGDKILIGREPACPYAQIGAEYDHFPVRKLALMGADTAAFFVVEGGMGTMEEFLELIAFDSRGYIEKGRDIYLVGKKFWTPILEATKKLDPNHNFSNIKLIEPEDFPKALKDLKPKIAKIQKRQANTPAFDGLHKLVDRKYSFHYEIWKDAKVDQLSFAGELSEGQKAKLASKVMDICELFSANSERRERVADKVIKLFVDHFYANTVFDSIQGPKPIALCGSQSSAKGVFEWVRDYIHVKHPETAVISRTPDKNVGLRISRSGLQGPETTDHPMRYTMALWPHIIRGTSAQIFLPGRLDTAWGLMTSIVAEQTHKPELPEYPAKIVCDPDGRILRFFNEVRDHVCSDEYRYASVATGKIPRIVRIDDPRNKAEILASLDEILSAHLTAN
jgi:predicted Rossmann-fold nucleotide-binding protein